MILLCLMALWGSPQLQVGLGFGLELGGMVVGVGPGGMVVGPGGMVVVDGLGGMVVGLVGQGMQPWPR